MTRVVPHKRVLAVALWGLVACSGSGSRADSQADVAAPQDTQQDTLAADDAGQTRAVDGQNGPLDAGAVFDADLADTTAPHDDTSVDVAQAEVDNEPADAESTDLAQQDAVVGDAEEADAVAQADSVEVDDVATAADATEMDGAPDGDVEAGDAGGEQDVQVADTDSSAADVAADVSVDDVATVEPDTAGSDDGAQTCDGPTCKGAVMPTWQLVDIQTKSAKSGQTYGLAAFSGKVTLVALLSST